MGDPSPIKHVFYVIRENRTYDQILGDLEKGNGDPTLCLFGEDVTPNAHALAREFVLLDSFYVDAEVSYSGHAFSTAAYATDFVNKVWPMNYGGRGGKYLSEGGGTTRNAYGNITAPEQGYIWDSCKRAGVSVRSYGEFATRDSGGRSQAAEANRGGGQGPVEATVPGLAGLVSPNYPPWDLRLPEGPSTKRLNDILRSVPSPSDDNLDQAHPMFTGLLIFDRLTLFLRLFLFGFAHQ